MVEQNNQQSRFDRYLFKAKYFLKMRLRSISPEAVAARRNGPKVILNSIPKSGTNLLLDIMDCWPQFQCRIGKTVDQWEALDENTARIISGLRRGQYAPAHLPYSDDLTKLIEETSCKIITIIRDPRDVYISAAMYLAHMDTTHRGHKHFASLKDDDARICAAIRGVDGVIAPIEVLLQKYAGWLVYQGGLIVRYEDLVCPGQSRLSALESVATYLDVPLCQDFLDRANKRIGVPGNLTFRSGRSYGWRTRLTANQIEMVRQSAAKGIEQYGYSLE